MDERNKEPRNKVVKCGRNGNVVQVSQGSSERERVSEARSRNREGKGREGGRGYHPPGSGGEGVKAATA